MGERDKKGEERQSREGIVSVHDVYCMIWTTEQAWDTAISDLPQCRADVTKRRHGYRYATKGTLCIRSNASRVPLPLSLRSWIPTFIDPILSRMHVTAGMRTGLVPKKKKLRQNDRASREGEARLKKKKRRK